MLLWCLVIGCLVLEPGIDPFLSQPAMRPMRDLTNSLGATLEFQQKVAKTAKIEKNTNVFFFAFLCGLLFKLFPFYVGALFLSGCQHNAPANTASVGNGRPQARTDFPPVPKPGTSAKSAALNSAGAREVASAWAAPPANLSDVPMKLKSRSRCPGAFGWVNTK